MKKILRTSIHVLLLSSTIHMAPSLAATTTRNIMHHALGGSGITSEALGGSGITSEALGGSGITSEALGGSGITSEALGGSGITSEALGGSGITSEALGGSGITSEALGGSGITSEALGGSGITSEALGGSGITSEALGGSGITSEALGGSGITSEALGGSGITSEALGGSGITSEALGGSGIYSEALGGSGITSEALGGSGITSEALGGSGITSEALGGSGIGNRGNRVRSSTHRQNVISGPIDFVDEQTQTVVVLGQQIRLTQTMFRKAIETAAEGASLEIIARRDLSGLSGIRMKTGSAYYVAGSDAVTISGEATWYSRDLGRIQIGDAVIDVTNLLASQNPNSLVSGKLTFSGIQPILGGIIVALQAE